MEANEETYQLFDSYLSGNLSGAEKDSFEKRLSEDALLREEFLWMSSAVNSIRMSGNQIFKKQLAEIGMGIPASAFEKYSPSIKPKNFFRKYWWAIAAVVSIAIALACLYYIKHKQEGEGESFANVTDVQKDNAHEMQLSYTNATLDSLQNAMCVDSAAAAPAEPGGQKPMPAVCPVGEGCRSFVISIDVSDHFYITQKNEGGVGKRKAGTEKISVTFCPQKTQPAFYSFATDIVICSSYSDSTKIRLFQNEAGKIIMTDGKAGFFTLVKGGGMKPLVREANRDAKAELKIPKDPFVDSVSVISNTFSSSESNKKQTQNKKSLFGDERGALK